MSEKKIIRVRDVMTDNYQLVDGMLMVDEALDIMKEVRQACPDRRQTP